MAFYADLWYNISQKSEQKEKSALWDMQDIQNYAKQQNKGPHNKNCANIPHFVRSSVSLCH